MKSLLTYLLLILSTQWVKAQYKSYDLSASYTFYNPGVFSRIKEIRSYSADFYYHIDKNFTILSGYHQGNFLYFDDVRTNVFPEPSEGPNATNGEGYQSHVYLGALYSIYRGAKINIDAGVGLGVFNQRLVYPYQGPSTNAGGRIISGESFSKLTIPFTATLYYLYNEKVGIGLKVGSYMIPNQGLLGTHIGPQIRCRL